MAITNLACATLSCATLSCATLSCATLSCAGLDRDWLCCLRRFLLLSLGLRSTATSSCETNGQSKVHVHVTTQGKAYGSTQSSRQFHRKKVSCLERDVHVTHHSQTLFRNMYIQCIHNYICISRQVYSLCIYRYTCWDQAKQLCRRIGPYRLLQECNLYPLIYEPTLFQTHLWDTNCYRYCYCSSRNHCWQQHSA